MLTKTLAFQKGVARSAVVLTFCAHIITLPSAVSVCCLWRSTANVWQKTLHAFCRRHLLTELCADDCWAHEGPCQRLIRPGCMNTHTVTLPWDSPRFQNYRLRKPVDLDLPSYSHGFGIMVSQFETNTNIVQNLCWCLLHGLNSVVKFCACITWKIPKKLLCSEDYSNYRL